LFEVSIIIPAFNEEQFIGNTLQKISLAIEACSVKAEIIVVDNDSDDKTALIAKGLGAKVVHEKMRQIARARNIGAKCAQAENLIFIDADTELNIPLFKETLDLLRQGDCVGGGATLKLDEESPALNKFIGIWNGISIKLKLAAGCFMFCKKSAFEAVGGFNEKVYASEEIWFIKKIKSEGRRRALRFQIIEKAPIVTSSRKFLWYSPKAMLLQMLLLSFFPFLCRYKYFCFMWYKRPKASHRAR